MNCLTSEHFESLFAGTALSSDAAHDLLRGLLRSEMSPALAAATLAVLRCRGVQADELRSFRSVLMESATRIDLTPLALLDIVGTGGDGKHSINLSTLSAIIVASTGVPVAKHGNYGATSRGGASTVLEALGVRFRSDGAFLRRCLEECNFCFLHAPLFHPALARLAVVRRELPFLSIFNLLGPICNPAAPRYAVLGAGHPEVARLYRQIAPSLFERFAVVSSLDGFDELSLTAPCRVVHSCGEQILDARSFGLAQLSAEALRAPETTAERAREFFELVRGRTKDARLAVQQEVAIAGAALAKQVVEPGLTLATAQELCREALYSGRSFRLLETMRELSESL